MDVRVKIIHDGNIDPIRKKANMPMSRVLRRNMLNLLQE